MIIQASVSLLLSCCVLCVVCCVLDSVLTLEVSECVSSSWLAADTGHSDKFRPLPPPATIHCDTIIQIQAANTNTKYKFQYGPKEQIQKVKFYLADTGHSDKFLFQPATMQRGTITQRKTANTKIQIPTKIMKTEEQTDI